MTAIPEVKRDDVVAYVPDICHAMGKDSRGERLFEFVHVANGPTRKGKPMHTASEVVTNWSEMGSLDHEKGARRDFVAGHIVTATGYPIKPTRPKKAWKAKVLTVKDGGLVDLEIDHPHGHKLECRDVPFSADKLDAPHSWHLAPEGV